MSSVEKTLISLLDYPPPAGGAKPRPAPPGRDNEPVLAPPTAQPQPDKPTQPDKPSEADQPTEPQEPAGPEKPAEPDEPAQPDKPPPAAADDSALRPEDFKLGGILQSGDEAHAIINDHLVSTGDEVNGARVVEIAKYHVVLQKAGRRLKLRL